MKKWQGMAILATVLSALSIIPKSGGAQPVQMFLDPVSEPVCRVPLEIEMLVLDNAGRVDTDITGKKEIQINVEENEGQEDKSFSIRSTKASFKKGVGSFIIENDEEELLTVHVAIPDLAITEKISLYFQDKDISPPEVISINADEPGIIRLEFNEALEEESAQKTSHYKAVTNQREVYPEAIEYHQDNVILEFEENFANDEEGHIEMEGIKDLSGNQISAGLKSPDFKGKCPCSTRF